ncbi:MAG TPA: 1,4-alpha-glucan branching protein domain-containing protein [Dissulfurispiraceae bacterium]|nr:1,4-alpha-glucan branching protein domain-containing protein [Dissulfurispiraceae bacterium]
MKAASSPSAACESSAVGYLALVLHAHLPFVRHPEFEDALEENWLYECITESYIPLLRVFDDLAEQGIDFKLTVSISPTLASMLRDPLLQARYLKRLEKLIELAGKEIRRTTAQSKVNSLAQMYLGRLQEVRDAFVHKYRRDLIQAFGYLQDLGKIEIITTAATHGYLPLLLPDESAVRAQVRTGVHYYRQLFGRKPHGFWLPECGYYPGIDSILSDEGIRYTILETHGITRAKPRPKYGVYAPLYCPSGLAVFGRDPESSRQVWSSAEGYPGDAYYREFYRDIAYDLDHDYIAPYIHSDGIRIDSGLKYYRITGKSGYKKIYSPEAAERKARIHARHFISEKKRQICNLSSKMDRSPVIVAPFDAELFGHWWYEGPKWLDYLIRGIAFAPAADKLRKTEPDGLIRLTTLSDYFEKYPSNQLSVPSASSWGNNGSNETWLNISNDWIYRHLHSGAQIMKELATSYPKAKGTARRAIKQAARELLLAQSSDWAFIIRSGPHSDYAVKRTKTHLLRLIRLRGQIKDDLIDNEWLSAIEQQNNIFPDIDYRMFE